MIILLIIIIVIILLIELYNIQFGQQKEVQVEHYLDLLPTYLIDNISRCYSKQCVIDESYKCYKYCAAIKQPNARENCKMSCEDFGDSMFKEMGYEYAIFGNSINKLVDYSILNE